jgi:hypothetical protein
MAQTDYDLGMTTGATFVSVPGNPPNQAIVGAPGSSGPGATMATHQAAMLLIGSSLAMLVLIGFVFRRGTSD